MIRRAPSGGAEPPPFRALAPAASRAEASRGRLHAEEPSRTRSDFQRDRDRIIHSTAFRRLTHKTQVFVYHEGDHYRTRLTHSLEVAQIARSLARTLALDEDLAEAIALAHDLGHPPFGHAGEKALDAAMRPYGGFDHNGQSLWVVTALERKYAAFDGLNLTWETLEGLAKHNGPVLTDAGAPAPEYAEKGVPRALALYNRTHDLDLYTHPSLEAQVAALADDIAYNNHDIDDGFRAGSYRLDDLAEVPLAGETIAQVRALYPDLEDSRLVYEVSRRLISRMIEDVVAQTRARLAGLAPANADAVRGAGQACVRFSDELNEGCNALRRFLFTQVYRHERVMRIMTDAQQIVGDLFARYMAEPDALPEKWQSRARSDGDAALAVHVCDFIAGMTDRYAVEEHRRLFDRTPELR